MSNESWISRLLGRGSGRAEAPMRSDSAEVSSDDGKEYRKHRDRGLRELEAGRLEEAMKALGRAVHLRPDLVEAHLNMGRAFERAGKVEAARQAYEWALKLDLTCAEARSALDALPSPPPEREDFQVGQMLRSSTTGSSYKVLEVKKGGFGAVSVVRRQDTGVLFALKTFQARYLWSDEDRERFEREAVTWVMLDRHPNIVTAPGVARIEGFPCLVLEYVPGGDLAQLLRKGPLPVERALELALQFCDGMAYAHEKLGIVHRDVKPANCLLTEDGTLKVTDFGLARAFGEAQEGLLGLSGLGAEVATQYTTPLGTHQYMAPEQFRAGAKLDTRTDVYAFGIMLYEMLTGDLPLVGSAAQAHIEENAAAYQLPGDLLRLIMRCVEPDPRKRPADFGQVRDALGAVYRTTTGRVGPAPAQPSPTGAAEWSNKGAALDNLGRHEEALACYDRGLEIAPRDSHLWNHKGVALRALRRYEDALACFERGLEIDPRDSRLRANKAIALRALRRHDEALAWYDKALEIDPRDSQLLRSKGIALSTLERYREALAWYDKALEIDPRDSFSWQAKGQALYEVGSYEEALACYDQGLEIDPRNAGLWQSKGAALGNLDRHEEELACFGRGLEIEARDSGLWMNKGLALLMLGRNGEALASSERGLEVDPRDGRLWNNKGLALLRLERYEEALACLERGLEIDPRDPCLWDDHGLALLMLDRYGEALACCERGLEIDPLNRRLWRTKGLALQALGRMREAEAAMQRAQTLGGG